MLRNDDYINLESFYRKVLAALRDARDTSYMSVFGTSQKGEVFDRLPTSEHRLWREYYDQHGNPFATELDCIEAFMKARLPDVKYFADRDRALKPAVSSGGG